ANRRIPLRGIERYGVAVNGVSINCMYSVLISGDMEQLLRFLPAALMRTFNRHPRMRALVLEDDIFTAEIQPPVTLEDVSVKKLLRVREFSQSEEDVAAWKNWAKFVEEETHVGFDRYTQFMFYLTVWVDRSAGQARLLLSSDHIVSDGDSCMVVLNDILGDVALLSIEAAKDVKEFPLRPSLYDMWFPQPFWLKPLAKLILALFGRSAFIGAMKAFKPVLPPRADQKDFGLPLIQNTTSALFADGDPSCMRSTLRRCKEEGVSFGGALIPVIVLAFYHASKKDKTAECGTPFKLAADLCFNMRQRVPTPAEERQVGLYVTNSSLPWLATEGVDMHTAKFWDLARRSKKELESQGEQLVTMAMPLFMMDRKLNAKSVGFFLQDYRIPSSVTGDATISNIGRYPYKTEHILAANGVLRVENMHAFASVPFVATSSTLWVSSLKAFNYSIAHKCDDEVGKELFKAYVSICEGASSIGSDDTMIDVLKRFNL
ncbi:hypothetical protein BBJ28_00026137, partial [Nothophytophthora sp. Chile5]